MSVEEKEKIPIAKAYLLNESFLEDINGVIFRQDAQYAEVVAQMCGIPWEKRNRYKFAPFPEGKKTLRQLDDKDGWKPSQEEINNANYTFNSEEESSCLTNSAFFCLGCVNLRPFKMKFTPFNGDETIFSLERPFTCGGVCFCPHIIELTRGGEVIGQVIEDWTLQNWCQRCCEMSFCCKVPYNMQLKTEEILENKYRIEVNLCLCGAHNNFCGATPCFNDMLFNVYKFEEAEVDYSKPVGYLQKTYGNSFGFDSCVRACCASAGQYLVEWPETATAEEKALFIATNVLLEYIFFENQGE